MDESSTGPLGRVGLLRLGSGGFQVRQRRLAFPAFGVIRLASEEQLEHAAHEILAFHLFRNTARHFDGYFAVGKGQGLLGRNAFGTAVALEVVGIVEGLQEFVLLPL